MFLDFHLHYSSFFYFSQERKVIMSVNKAKIPTKDGKCWFYRVCYRDEFNALKRYNSKKYATRSEAKEAELEYLNKLKEIVNVPVKMTIGDLWKAFLEYQDDKVRLSTKVGYKYRSKHLEPLFNIKCVDFNIMYFENWKKLMNSNPNMKDVSKNDILKVLKALLHFGIKRYNFNFNQVILLMEKFKNPEEKKSERQIYEYDEFLKFLSSEDDLRYKCLWETLYYGGLRIGEARGLTWEDIDFNNKRLYINKQVLSIDSYSSNFYVANPKTDSSIRDIPIADELLNDLKEYYNEVSQFKNFDKKFYVFGNDYGIRPLAYKQAQRRKGEIANKAGVKEIRLHDFRHSCASLLVNNKAPITVVSSFMGHSNTTETLNTYSHLFKGALNETMDVINNLKK